MSFAYAFSLAACAKGRLSMLDWGGGLGHYYYYARALFPGVAIDYHCYELPGLCKAGHELSPSLHFCSDESELCDRVFDFVLSSSSLHYFQDWQAVLRRLAAATGTFLYVARLQTVVAEPSFVVRQSPEAYQTSYPSWFVNRAELLSAAQDAHLVLEREFVYAEKWHVRGAPEQGSARGFLFRKAPS
jgi:putative methyltransferase (TIGR04325 family)